MVKLVQKFQNETGERKPAMMDENKLRPSGFWVWTLHQQKSDNKNDN